MLKPFATKIPEEALKELDRLAQKTGIPKARLCKQAIELLVEHYRQRDEDLVLGKKVREAERLQPV